VLLQLDTSAAALLPHLNRDDIDAAAAGAKQQTQQQMQRRGGMRLSRTGSAGPTAGAIAAAASALAAAAALDGKAPATAGVCLRGTGVCGMSPVDMCGYAIVMRTQRACLVIIEAGHFTMLMVSAGVPAGAPAGSLHHSSHSSNHQADKAKLLHRKTVIHLNTVDRCAGWLAGWGFGSTP
jgi:hypothetical protein